MKLTLTLKISALCLLYAMQQASAATYYVATNGNDSNNGSVSSPFKTLTKAISSAASNDIINVASGTYTTSTKITIGKSNLTIKGTFTSAATRPLFDFSGMSTGNSNQGIVLTSNGCTIYGIQLKGAGDNGIQITGDNNKIEFCTFYENDDSGLQLDGGAAGNQIKNCDSYYNADPDQGDADGFACKLDVGQNNVFDGCRAWNNSDDGWDGYLRGANNINTTIKNSWAMKNGYLKSGAASSGNGSGFKMGGSDDKDLSHNQTLTNCFAFQNRRRGFHANNNTGSMTLLNCTAYGDKTDPGDILYMLPLVLASGKTQTLKNCVAFGPATPYQLIPATVQATNSWMSQFTVTEADFVNVNFTEAYASRKIDGSLPDINVMHLALGSDLVNTGTEVGLPFIGSKPDLGAFESSFITGFEENPFGENITGALYPNPSNGVFTYKADGNEQFVKIYNQLGIVVMEKQLEQGHPEHTFDLSSMVPGTYIFKINNGSVSKNLSLIITK